MVYLTYYALVILSMEARRRHRLTACVLGCLFLSTTNLMSRIVFSLSSSKRTLSPVRLNLKGKLFLLLHCTGVFLCIWGVLISRLDYTQIAVYQDIE